MAGYHGVVVGFRYDDRRRHRKDELGNEMKPAGRCIGCGQPTYLHESGCQAIRDRDANPICDWCYQVDKTHVQEAL